MHRQDEIMDHNSEQSPAADETSKPIDFTVDSAGNVSPGTRQRAARMAERPQPSQNPLRTTG